MKKILLFAFMLTVSAGAFATTEKTMCTIVVSPCEQVPNTLFEGKATVQQIKEAQERMLHDCGM